MMSLKFEEQAKELYYMAVDGHSTDNGPDFNAMKAIEMALRGAATIDQTAVAAWIMNTLGEESASNGPERSLRLAEEAIELTQSLGVDRETLHKLVDYVYERPPGTPAQEIAGCQVTLYGVAAAIGVNAHEAFYAELDRISQPDVIERVRRRQAEKRAALK